MNELCGRIHSQVISFEFIYRINHKILILEGTSILLKSSSPLPLGKKLIELHVLLCLHFVKRIYNLDNRNGRF